MQTLIIAALVAAVPFAAPAHAGGWQLAPIPDSAIHAELLESESGALSVRLSVWPDLGFADFGPGAVDILGPEGWLAQKWAKPPYDFTMDVIPGESYFVRARIWRKGGEVGRQGALWTSSTTVLCIEAAEEEPEFPSPTVVPSVPPPPVPAEPAGVTLSYGEIEKIARDNYDAGFADAKKGYEEASAKEPTSPTGQVVVRLQDEAGRSVFGAVRLVHAAGTTDAEGTGQVRVRVAPGPISLLIRQEAGFRWLLSSGQRPQAELSSAGETILWDLRRVPGGAQ